MTCPAPAGNCTAARAGGNFNDNDFNMGFLDADTDPATTNSSIDVALPADSTMLHAQLIWGGRKLAGSGGAAAAATLSQVSFRTRPCNVNVPINGFLTPASAHQFRVHRRQDRRRG